MKTLALFGIILTAVNFPAFAGSNIVGTILSSGDLSIKILDRPDSPPYDAATIWEAMEGSNSKKVINSPQFSLGCETLMTEPTHVRFGSCKISVDVEKIRHDNGRYMAIFRGNSAKDILAGFVGGSNPDNSPTTIHLADGKMSIEVAPHEVMFAIRIEESLVQ